MRSLVRRWTNKRSHRIEAMKLLRHFHFKPALALSVTFSICLTSLVTPRAAAQSKLQAPTTHVSDAAGVIDEATRQQLETLLSNLQQRAGINFVVITVPTTSGRDIFDFSRELARDWDIGAQTSTGKSLLLVVSVEDKALATRFSKQIPRALPEGSLATMNDHVRAAMNSGHVSEALLTGVRKFVGDVADKNGISREAMEQPTGTQTAENQAATNAVSQPSPPASSTPEVTAKSAEITNSAENKLPAETSTPKNQTATARADKSNAQSTATRTNTPADDEAEAEEVELTLTKPVAERVELLKTFLVDHPESKAKARATELLIGARAAVGDMRLKAGEVAAGIEQLMQVIADSPIDISEQLYSGVIAQIPLNLYLRGEQSGALKAASLIESKFGGDPKRLLPLSAFYVGIERGEDAARVAEQAVKLAPDMPEAHHALGLALHISLRLDEAAAEYKRALELDARTPSVRRSLADLDRAGGKFEEALALYREQLTATPNDKGARAGLVLALYELGRTEDADKEFDAALNDDPRNLAVLAATAYWLVAHNDSKRGLELAKRAVDIEPRYTWSQIALARALIAQRSPLSAERALRFAQQYGRFPTLDYELASALSSQGLYEEAAEFLTRSFTIKEGQIETKLAGRIPVQAASFVELLAPERRASIFLPLAADSENNARALKGLLTFTTALNATGADTTINEASAIAAAQEFAAGNDEMNVYRKLYAASRLLGHGIGFQAAQELADAAREGVVAATYAPAVTVAVQADELRDIRARALASGGTPDIPEAPRNVLASILRGRIEDLSGWALFNQDKVPEATERLRRAVTVLPERTPAWLTATWHFGAALQQSGKDEEALGYYIKSYAAGSRDAARRGIIEQLYKKVNGSLDGLDDRIGRAPVVASAAPPTSMTTPAEQATADSSETASPAPSPTPGPTPTPVPAETPATGPPVEAAPSPSPEASPAVNPAVPPAAEAKPSPEPSATPAPTPIEQPPVTQPTPTPNPEPGNAPKSEPPLPEPTPTPAPTPSEITRPRRVKPPGVSSRQGTVALPEDVPAETTVSPREGGT